MFRLVCCVPAKHVIVGAGRILMLTMLIFVSVRFVDIVVRRNLLSVCGLWLMIVACWELILDRTRVVDMDKLSVSLVAILWPVNFCILLALNNMFTLMVG